MSESYTAAMSLQSRFRFSCARLADGWQRNVVISIDPAGDIVDIATNDVVTTARSISGAAIPGMPNVHSHAFQRAMAGLAEARGDLQDSFWTWRERMYALANALTPEFLNAIAAQLYVDLIKNGYTSVCEFHYLHGIGSDPLSAGHALIDAASSAGIALTLLPTLYERAGFNQQAPADRQRNFVLSVDAFLRLLESLRNATASSSQTNIGLALHSLRAVSLQSMRSVLESGIATANPIHIHIAEQLAEVDACQRHLGTTPVRWLLDNVNVDARWCLVHATHATSEELTAISRQSAGVCLCPTTEANLGDGLFDTKAFIQHGGRCSIGSDSNVSVAPAEELRWIEYQQRLVRRERNVMPDGACRSTGEFLWQHAARAGAAASGRRAGVLEVGARADIVVLDTNLPVFAGRREDEMLDTFIFAATADVVRDVMVGGRWLVQERKHFAETAIASGYRRAIAKIRD
ncbi:MAG TPA: formimidoylglutamate deiminase, partial [Steroidobacteraceae bacterium]|nr:formimidoylglutamate deiminase [Steroidobacteraceae bacterium]